MKTFVTPPENADFFSKNALVYKIGITLTTTALIFGIVSEFAVTYGLMSRHIAEFLPTMAILPYLIAALAGYLVYVLAKERIRTGRQVSKLIVDPNARALGNATNGIMLVAFLLVYGVSIALSYFGTLNGVQTAIAPPTLHNTAPIDSTAADAKAIATANYETQKKDLATAYDAKIDATRRQHNSQIQPLEARKKGASAADKRWLQTKIDPLIATRNEAIAKLKTEKSEALIGLANTHTQELSLISQQAGAEKQTIIDSNQSRSARHEWFMGIANKWFPIIICIALALGFIGTYLKEKVMHASGMTETYVPDDSDLQPHPVMEFFEAIARRLRINWRMWVNGFDAATAEKWDSFEYKDSTTALLRLQVNGRFKEKQLNIGKDRYKPVAFNNQPEETEPEPNHEARKRRLAGFNRYKDRTNEDAHNMHTVGFGEEKGVYTEAEDVYTAAEAKPEDLLNSYKVARRDYVAYRNKTDAKPETIQAGMAAAAQKMASIEAQLHAIGYKVIATPKRIFLQEL